MMVLDFAGAGVVPCIENKMVLTTSSKYLGKMDGFDDKASKRACID